MGHSHIDFKFWTDAKHTRQRQNMVLLPCVYLSSLQKIVVLKPASGPLYEFYAISTEMAVPHKLQCYQLFNTFTRLDLTKHHWWGCNTWKVRPVHYIKFMSFQQKWRIQVTISFWFSCTVLCYFNKMLYHVNYGVCQQSIYLHGLIWPSITDEDWIPETRVRSILSILCDFNKMAYRINFSVIQFSIHLHDLIWPNITDEDSYLKRASGPLYLFYAISTEMASLVCFCHCEIL